jgi:hypothetical protein
MNNAMIFAGVLFIALMGLMLYMPKGDGKVKLSFEPVQGEKSGYFDCEAKDSKGMAWRSIGGVWDRVK